MFSGGAAMAHYDPETLIVLRKALDEAWAALPKGSQSETLKSEMAQRILQQAANGERDPVILRSCALASIAGEPLASTNDRTERRPRRRIIHKETFEERLAEEARRFKKAAEEQPPGSTARELLLRRSRQAETASRMNDLLSSPGRASPK
jgi:hypothetical protein